MKREIFGYHDIAPPTDFNLAQLNRYNPEPGTAHPAAFDAPTIHFPEIGLALCIGERNYSVFVMDPDSRKVKPNALKWTKQFGEVVETIDRYKGLYAITAPIKKQKPMPDFAKAAIGRSLFQRGIFAFERADVLNLIKMKRDKAIKTGSNYDAALYLKKTNDEVGFVLVSRPKGKSGKVEISICPELDREAFIERYSLFADFSEPLRVPVEALIAEGDSDLEYVTFSIDNSGVYYERSPL